MNIRFSTNAKSFGRWRSISRFPCALCVIFTLTACSSHPDCEQADIFGHCKKWEGVENTCENPDFLGFCPPSKESSDK